MRSGLAELQQLHVEPNSEHSTYLHCSSPHCRQRKAGQGLEMRVQASRAIRASNARAAMCGGQQWPYSTSQFHTLKLTLFVPMHVVHKAWYGYVLLIPLCVGVLTGTSYVWPTGFHDSGRWSNRDWKGRIFHIWVRVRVPLIIRSASWPVLAIGMRCHKMQWHFKRNHPRLLLRA